MLKTHKTAISFILLLACGFAAFIFLFELRFTAQKQQEVDNHAQVVAGSVWTLFTPVTDQYLALAVKSDDYQQMQLKSLIDQKLFSAQTELRGFATLLYDLGLIRVEEFHADIFYNKQRIGELYVGAFNKNIYLYSYLCIVLILSCLLIWFVGLVFDERKNLRMRVTEKTAELENYNLQLQDEIQERVRSEKALRESEQTFLALFDHSFQFIALLDPECRVEKCNQTALSFRGLKEEDIVGEYFWDTPWWQHSETLIKQLKAAYQVARNGEIARFEAHSTEIKEIFLDISVKPVFDDNGEIIHLLAEARDITEVRRAEQELQQAQKMESVGTLAGGIAHDFNNILGGILGTLALLKLKRDKGQTLPEEKLFRYLDTITETALRAKDMVSQLLTLSRKYDLKFAPVNLYDILQNVLNIAGNSFDKSITIAVQTDRQLPVKADANSLEQVFLNICINASHAMTIMRPPGEAWGGTLEIQVRSLYLDKLLDRKAGNFWCVSISDNGVGIDNANLKKIFIPFFSTKTKDAGTGLGLSMVYNIIKQHNGFIDVNSQLGRGSCFNIYLPVCLEDQIVPNDTTEPELSPGEGLILIIDDEELIRNNAAELLTECGYQVIQAEDGVQGVEIYQQMQEQIDAVLLDLVMPIMSGKETYTALRDINPQVRVLLSSGFRQDERVDEILAAGAKGFIQKPYTLQDLSQRVKTILA